MSKQKPDFFVIYNRALNPIAETEDTKLSLELTEHLVSFLEDRGHCGIYADRDARLGSNVFSELFKNIRDTRKTFVIVTPEFLRNCWAVYSSQACFKELVDTRKSHKLIAVGLGIADNEKLHELNIQEWIHFPCEWSESNNPLKWNLISKVFDHEGPLSDQTVYQEYIHSQECGDNRLRSDKQNLVVQTDSLHDDNKVFLMDRFLHNLGQKFPSTWQSLGINLGLKDHKVKEIERNYQGNVHMQAYNALLSWRNSYGRSEEEKVNHLLSVLREMTFNDVADDIEEKYKEFTQPKIPDQCASEGLDEPDMGMSRNRVPQVIYNRTTTERSAWSQNTSEKVRNTDDDPKHTNYVARELKAEKAAVIQAKPQPHAEVPSASLDTVQLSEGPSMSLPSAKFVSLPSKEKDVAIQNPEVQGPCNLNNSIPREDGNHDLTHNSEVQEHISKTKSQDHSYAQNVKLKIQLAGNKGIDNATDDKQSERVEVKYTSQQSLSKDEDLTADANGSFSFQQPEFPSESSDLTKPNSLDLNQNNHVDHLQNLDLPSGEDTCTSSDSGYSCSARETPVTEAIVPLENRKLETAQKHEEKVNQSEESWGHQTPEKSKQTENQSGKICGHKSVEKSEHEENQSVETISSPEEADSVLEDNFDCVLKNQTEYEGESNMIEDSTQNSLSSEQGKSSKTRWIGYVISGVVKFLWRPELAYH